MSRRQAKPKRRIMCSRYECPDQAITSIVENGIRHPLCKRCWNLAMDRKDKLAAEASSAVDYKTLAAGGGNE